jgi:hypothetical protein
MPDSIIVNQPCTGSGFRYDSTMSRTAARPLLSEDHAAFVSGGRSIVVASASDVRVPAMARGLGCQVSADRRTVTLVLHSQQAAELIETLRGSGRIAVVFSDPPTHRALQLKGFDARVLTASPPRLRAIADAHIAAFAAAVGPLRFSMDLVRTVVRGSVAAPLVAVRFTPEAAFQQTPGLRAGERLP